jgi:hypothetical protein
MGASDETDLQVYDLDLSTLLGDAEEASDGVAAQTQEATREVALELEADTVKLRADAPARAKPVGSDDDVEVYDLDLNLLEGSFDDQPAAVAAQSSPRAEAKPSPAVKDASTARQRPAGQPIAQSDVAAAAAKLNASAEEMDVTPEAEPTRHEIEEDERVVIHSGIWAPLQLGAHQLWPRLESGVAQPPRLAVVGPADAPVVAILPTTPSESKRPEWFKVLKSLRRDHPRPQVAQTQTESSTAAVRAEAPQPGQPPTAPAPTKAQAGPQGGTLSKSRKRRIARKAKRKNAVRNEWGFFDPEQVGFAALVNKLDELVDKSDDGFPSDS